MLNYFSCQFASTYFLICLFSFPYAYFSSSLLITNLSSAFLFPNCRLFSLVFSLYSIVFSSFLFLKVQTYFLSLLQISLQLFSSQICRLFSLVFSLYSLVLSSFSFPKVQSYFLSSFFLSPSHNKSQNSPLQFPNCRPFLSKSSSDFFFFSGFPYFSFSSHFVNTTNLSSLQS